ncbi:hypothetical protein [Segniliparus rotundus]|uniref:hypothetical protein n=1 Tax=Segniliparus rotundus TaxID=286802 RepID=UPI0011D13C9A|nr:hypothetical protein [Segniliparus rotundus]
MQLLLAVAVQADSGVVFAPCGEAKAGALLGAVQPFEWAGHVCAFLSEGFRGAIRPEKSARKRDGDWFGFGRCPIDVPPLIFVTAFLFVKPDRRIREKSFSGAPGSVFRTNFFRSRHVSKGSGARR